MRAPPPPVTIAVVSWNTRELLVRCLSSLADDVRARRADVLVIDNGSRDGSVDAAVGAAPWAEVIRADRNLGFGAAVNAVAARTRSEWLLAANGDVALEPGALQALLYRGRDPRLATVAPRLLLPGGETQHSVHPFPTLALTLAFNLGAHRISPALAERLCLAGGWDPSRGRLIPWAVGACLLVRRCAFEAVGGFDERQWLYAEDVDLAWRLRRAGWLSAYEPAARVRHAAGASTLSAFGERRMTRALEATYVMIARRRGPARMALTAAINIAGAALRAAWLTPLAPFSGGRRAAAAEQWRWCVAHLRGALMGRVPAPVRFEAPR